jgi:hypothetical protein
MKVVSMQTSKIIRCQHNRNVLVKFRNNESLSSFSNRSSWFPPRGVTKKSNDALKFFQSRRTVLTFKKK